MENNQLKCDDYSLLFSTRADDDEQHFNSDDLHVFLQG